MRYRIERIGLGSALRIAGMIGLVIWLIPSLFLSGVIVSAVLHLLEAFARLANLTIVLPAQTIGPLTLQLPPLGVDLVDRLGLQTAAHMVGTLSAHPWSLFLAIALGLVL